MSVMLTVALSVLVTAALLGCVLAVLYLRTEGAVATPWLLAALHGLIGVSGLLCLAIALRGPVRGVEQGAESFGIVAAILIGLAALIGITLLLMRRLKRRLPEITIGIHATFAIGGLAMLTVYVFAG